jgi:hypothetical protein
MKIDVSTILNAKTLNTRAEVEAFVRNAFAPSFQPKEEDEKTFKAKPQSFKRTE